MSYVIRYRGASDRRIITADQWLSVGITAPDAVWSKANGFELVLDDVAAAYALTQGEFEAGDPNTTFGAVLNKSKLQSVGASVPQAAATTLYNRFLQYIKDSGSAAPPVGWNYLGGDLPGGIYVPESNDLLWVFADGFDSGLSSVDATTEHYTTSALPIVNGGILEVNAGTFTGAIQLYRSGNAGVWMDAVIDGGHIAGREWWTIVPFNDGGVYRVGAWRMVRPPGTPHGDLIDNDLITLNAFLGYGSHVQTGIGLLTPDFWIHNIFRDTTHTYIYGMEFYPPFDVRTPAAPTAPNYVLDDPENHFTRHRVARVVNGSFTNVAAWTWWDGSGWVADVTEAQPIVDVNGAEVRGDMAVKKVATDHYLFATHPLMDSHLHVYKGTTPQGPVWPICEVPIPGMGNQVNGAYQVGQLPFFVPTQAQAPLAEHSLVGISLNLANPAIGYSFPEPWTQVKIQRFCVKIIQVPHN